MHVWAFLFLHYKHISEYISTNERRRVAGVGLDELDATRVANQKGSEAHRAAELNKARLAGWASKLSMNDTCSGLNM